MSIVKRLLGEAGIYGIAAALNSLVGVFLVPLYAHTFAPAEYGVISLINSTNTLCTILAVCALDNSSAVWYWDKREPVERARTFTTWFFSSGAIGLFITLSLLAFHRTFADVVLGSARYRNVAIVVACVQALWALPRVANLWFRNERKPVVAVSLALASSGSTAIACIAFVRFLHWGIMGVAAGQAVGVIVATVFARISLRGVVKTELFDSHRARQMLVFSSPLVISGLFAWCMGPAAPYVLTLAGMRADAGLFQVGSSLASVAAFGAFAFSQAWTPFALEIAPEPRAASLYAIVTEAVLVVGLIGTLLAHALARDVLLWVVGPRYADAGHAATILIFTQVVAALPQIFGITFTIAKSARPLAWASAIGAVATVAGFVVLVPRFERDGAAMAVFLGACCSCAYSFHASQRAFYLPVGLGRILLLLIGFVLAVVSVSLTGHALGGAVGLLGRAGVVLLFVCFAVFVYRDVLRGVRAVSP